MFKIVFLVNMFLFSTYIYADYVNVADSNGVSKKTKSCILKCKRTLTLKKERCRKFKDYRVEKCMYNNLKRNKTCQINCKFKERKQERES